MATTATQLERYAVEEQTLEMIRDLLTELGSRQAAGSAGLHSSFDRDLGLGSLERVELLVRCEAKFGVQLPDEIAQEAETPAEWVRAILDGADGGAPAVQTRYRIVPPARQAPPEPASATTLVEALGRHTEVEPDRIHIHLPEDESGQDITYRELLETATAVAAGLADAGLERNQTVAIMLPTCADFFFAFFGVILAGGIPVPIYPPTRPDKIEEYVRRQVRILSNAEVRFLITFSRVMAISQLLRVNLPSLRDVTSVEALRQAGAGTAPRAVAPAETGFIQYTSGSTGDPKGVVLSHANILANVRGIGHSVQVRPDDIVVTWLPLYHDMGLIGSWLFSLYYGTPITVLSPLAFLSRPERWLWAMHDARGSLCPAPNFSYELCARKIPDSAVEGLDLSSWRVAINAGEAVLAGTLARFTERFARYGFRPEAWVPCYGLAESSVALTFPPINRRPVIDTIDRRTFETAGRALPAGEPSGEPGACGERDVIRFVANGSPMPRHEIRVVDSDGRDAPERVQGRLLFRGPSRTPGYYRNPQATAVSIDASGWMDSGDLAYWAGGEIYITGRLKDCIIKAGHNIIPQEAEAAAAEVPGVRRGCVAAFGVADAATGTERLVVVAETRATRREELGRIEADIIKAVDAAIGMPPDNVQLVSPQSIPKTSSGKIRRFEARSLFLSGALKARKPPAWLQIARLAVESGGSWTRLALREAAEWLRRAYTFTLLLSTAAAAGLLARLIPSRRAGGRVLRLGARAFLWLSRYEIEVHGDEHIGRGRPAVFVANHPGRLDPFVLAAAIPAPFLFADAGTLSGLPRPITSLLRPLIVPGVPGETAPPGGTLRQRVQRALERGHAVLVFPEARIGELPHRSPFRLDAFHAAVETGSPVYPIAALGTSHLLSRHPALRKKPRIVIGEAVLPEAGGGREIVTLRDQVREAIARSWQ
ncbi:MAG TPA: AMP-binding protein [Bryobacterales bacterium]|nr:AMP-binding protein [Bryobacterales bacterium]